MNLTFAQLVRATGMRLLYGADAITPLIHLGIDHPDLYLAAGRLWASWGRSSNHTE